MKFFKIIAILILFFCFSCKEQKQKDPSHSLYQIISEIEDRKGYDEEAYPLGLFTKEYFKKEMKDFKGEFNQEIDLKNAPKGALTNTLVKELKNRKSEIITILKQSSS